MLSDPTEDNESIVLRELNHIEYFLYMVDKMFNSLFVIYARIQITGNLNENILNEALVSIYLKYPIMHATIRDKIKGAVFCRGNKVPSNPLIVIDKVDADQWKLIGKEESRKKINTRIGPLGRIYLLKDKKNNVHDLVAITHHCIADHVSNQNILHDLFLLYNKIKDKTLKKADFAEIPIKTHIFRDDIKKYYQDMYKSNPNLSFIKPKIQFLDVKYSLKNIILTPFRKLRNKPYNESFVAVGHISEQLTSQIVSSCSTHGVTLPGLLIAAYLMSIMSESNNDGFVSDLALDLRRYYKPPVTQNEIGCYVESYVGLSYDLKYSSDLWELAKKCNHEITNNALYQIFITPRSSLFPLPKSKIMQFIISKLIRFGLSWLSLFTNYVSSYISIAGDVTLTCSDDFKVTAWNWAASDTFLKGYRIKHFALGSVIVNGELNVTITCNISESLSQSIIDKILVLLKARI